MCDRGAIRNVNGNNVDVGSDVEERRFSAAIAAIRIRVRLQAYRKRRLINRAFRRCDL
jgi:hypothetical protein